MGQNRLHMVFLGGNITGVFGWPDGQSGVCTVFLGGNITGV